MTVHLVRKTLGKSGLNVIKINDKSLEKILWLSDTDLNQALCLIGNQFKNIGSLVDPVLFQERASHEFDRRLMIHAFL